MAGRPGTPSKKWVYRSPTPFLSTPPPDRASCRSLIQSKELLPLPTPHTSQRECSRVLIRRGCYPLAQNPPMDQAPALSMVAMYLHAPGAATWPAIPLSPWASSCGSPRSAGANLHLPCSSYSFSHLDNFFSCHCFALESAPATASLVHLMPKARRLTQVHKAAWGKPDALCQRVGGWVLPYIPSLTSCGLFAG